ncbi:MAG: hypothetical protein Q9227_007150 [Pyrenula ochraceoflavens]
MATSSRLRRLLKTDKPSESGNAEAKVDELSRDVLQLAEMGYEQDMTRKFSMWSVLGSGFSLTNSWFAISAALATGINSGGPVLLIYGIILCCVMSIGVGITLSELASAMPNAGGQYFWTNELAPRRIANFASYITGWFAWAGAVFTSAAVAQGAGSAVVGCWQLTHPDLVIKPWMPLVAYELINLFAFFFNCYGRTLPKVAAVALYTSLISFIVIFTTVPARAPTFQTARFVFVQFENNTGWSQGGIAFIVGLINTNWAFACLDCATHLAEEVPRPSRVIPIAIMSTVAIGFVTAWAFSISMMFSIQSFDLIYGSPTLVPLLELFHQALGNTAGAVALEALVIATGILCLVSSHTWQSRLLWSFARDRGIFLYSLFSKVDPVLEVPLYAHIFSCFLVALVGLISYGSTAAFGSFPSAMPVAASNMNYVCVVYGILVLIIAIDWLFRARKSFRDVRARREDRFERAAALNQAEIEMQNMKQGTVLRKNTQPESTTEGEVDKSLDSGHDHLKGV